MTNLFKKYETDNRKEALDGVEIDIDGAIFICRRAGGGNRRYRAAISVGLNKPGVSARINSEDKVIAFEADDEISIEAYADSVVLDWKNVTDRNDEPWPYTKENFTELMHACPELWLTLRSKASDIEQFRVGQVKEKGEELGKS